MSNDYLSSLPEDMIDEISTFFQHGNTLLSFNRNDSEPNKSYRALAQTCKSLRAHFQRRLFSHLYLPVCPRICKFMELVQNNPILASYIQTIALEVDNTCMGHFQYPPLLAIMHAASSFGTSPKICLHIGYHWSLIDELVNLPFPSNTLTPILNAPQTILHAVTDIQVERMNVAIPVSLFRLLPNLRLVHGSRFFLSSIDDKSSDNDNCSSEDHTVKYFRPKLDVLILDLCNLDTVKMLCEQIDLSAIQELVLSWKQMGATGTDSMNPNAKRLLAWYLLDRTQSVQKLKLDIGEVGPFYDLSRLQHLRRCTFELEVQGGINPVQHLCQLLHTLPPLPEHDLEYLHLSFYLTDTPLDANDISNSHVIFSVNTWSKFDNALVNVISSGTRPFTLTLAFYIPTRNNSVKLSLKKLFVDWGRKYLTKSSRQPNLNIVIHHPYSYSS
ncbi:hypothetical protein BDN70DRAFT_998284 [Pholiota conissans]|uniref:Uncharacterized protein n=1 Tax=Pholiota conissans TaxID=109636 RepID=A0A9P5YLV2_9AGAR|nr:hypothetical protein BDN70DRAFT_998284 [Pholiota conissans]